MPTPTKNPSWKFSPSFALISVLALVSLAALTATAFLASARLERQASSSIGKTTLVEMALDSGKYCMSQVINDYCQADNGNTHIVTYWRTNRNDELGYPFIAKIKTSGNNYGQRSAAWYYTPLFSPAGVTNLGTNDIQNAMRFTNTNQGTFSNDMRTYMSANATNGFINNPGLNHPRCIQIPLLGGRTSPPVGWVYINQEKRKYGSNITNTSPAVRIAWFTEDLEGLIDADRMGAATTRSTGTNSEEISLSSAKDPNNAIMVPSIPAFTNNRKAYISYGMLASSSLSGLNSSTNARYFASGLRSWMPTNPASPTNGAVEWIPVGLPITNSGGVALGYKNQGYTKISLNKMIASGSAFADIASVITNNLPLFTNRAGGMNGSTYVNALAANIIDYADANSTPSTNTVGGNTVIGYDSYPLLTHLYDEFTYSSAARTITHRTWMQFWNPSTKSIAGNVTVTFTNNDTVRYTNSATPPVVVTRPLVTNAVGSVKGVTTTTFTLPTIQPNCGYVTSFTRPAINLGNAVEFPLFRPVGDPLIANLYINTTTANPPTTALPCSNSFSYLWGGATIAPAMTIKRQNNTLNNGAPAYCAGFLAGNQYIPGAAFAGTPLPIHDPRMTPYLGRGSANQYAQSSYATTYWTGYVSQSGLSANMGLADPAFWPDGSNTNLTIAQHGAVGGTAAPTPGLFTNAQPAPCKISNAGSYSNIFELGNIFDPIQWAPPTPTTTTNYSNSDINTNAGTIWTKNNLYGGGSTLRIGRPEHSLFAFTNFGSSGNPIPNMGQSAAALLDLFCITNLTNGSPSGPYTLGAGRINLNTAPGPVLAALAGGILLSRDPNKAGSEVSQTMINAFTNGVMRFRHLYPFLSPSQLLFISANYGDANWTNSAVWSNAAVFSLNQGLSGITSLNDEGREEWFSKIYALSSCQSHNFRIYVVAQLVATNSSGQTNAIGPLVKKYYQVYFQNGSSVSTVQTNDYSTNNPWTWVPTGSAIDIYQSSY